MRTSTCVMSLLVFSSSALAQNAVTQPAPSFPASVLGPQLVAWSELQKPQPIPHFALSAQPGSRIQVEQPPETRPLPIQLFAGTIVKEGKTYTLKISGADSPQIDDETQIRPYEGRQVAIAGSLDPKTNALRVTSIEPLP